MSAYKIKQSVNDKKYDNGQKRNNAHSVVNI